MKGNMYKIELFKAVHFSNKSFPILLIILFLLSSGCSTGTDEKLEEGLVPFEVLREIQSISQNVFQCSFNRENIEDSGFSGRANLSRLELVIMSEFDFDRYISCEDTVSVNFDEEFVIAGMSTSQSTEIYINNQNLEFLNDTIYYHVGIVFSDAFIPGGAEYIIKVLSKKYIEYPVVFDIYDINED